jgi:hypothetical protein
MARLSPLESLTIRAHSAGASWAGVEGSGVFPPDSVALVALQLQNGLFGAAFNDARVGEAFATELANEGRQVGLYRLNDGTVEEARVAEPTNTPAERAALALAIRTAEPAPPPPGSRPQLATVEGVPVEPPPADDDEADAIAEEGQAAYDAARAVVEGVGFTVATVEEAARPEDGAWAHLNTAARAVPWGEGEGEGVRFHGELTPPDDMPADVRERLEAAIKRCDKAQREAAAIARGFPLLFALAGLITVRTFWLFPPWFDLLAVTVEVCLAGIAARARNWLALIIWLSVIGLSLAGYFLASVAPRPGLLGGVP